MELTLKYSDHSVLNNVLPDWNKMVEENESLWLPDVNNVPLANVFIDTESNEVHIDDKIIRLPVDSVPTTQVIQKIETGSDAPIYLRSLPLTLETIVTLSSESYLIDEGNVKQFTMGELANLVHINDFTTNMYSFWILDTLGTIIWEARKKNMAMENQATLINWFFYFIRTLKYTSLPRKEFFRIIKPLFLRTEEWMNTNLTPTVPLITGKNISLPLKLKKKQKAPSNEFVGEANLGKMPSEYMDNNPQPRQSQIFYMAGSEILDLGQDLKIYAEKIYNIFSGRLEYEIIREVFWNEPIIETVQLSDRIMIPKPLKSKIDVFNLMQDGAPQTSQAGKQAAKKKSISGGSRKSVSRKSVSRKSVSRKSVTKSDSRKSVSRKSVTKSDSRKSVSRKSVSRKSVSGGKGGKGGPGKSGSKQSSTKESTVKKDSRKVSSAANLEMLARAMAEKAKREEQTCLQFLKDAVEPKSLEVILDFKTNIFLNSLQVCFIVL
ncbi:uncharacterized protein LOC106672905 isoform X2 [Cimex lectularius]|uniref:Uncharacterized protein n=1 Tax=Cimex lectularius TaxID=79782 RepID=A0A8I6SE10_CIMLE|nr:uncharacterized protein LOC106672905 isoform X2 [Cimex lectularius]